MAQANVIMVDDLNAATDSIFYRPSQSMQEYIHQGVNSYMSAVKNVAPNFARIVGEKYAEIKNSAAIQYVNNLKNRINSIWQPDSIRYLSDVTSIQNASETMRRWIMAEPITRERYLNGAISGYGNCYTSSDRIGVGNSHYDYRRVMDGVVALNDDGVSEYTVYYEEIINSEDILSLVDKTSILGSWDTIKRHIDSGDNHDHTSQWNELY